MFALSPVFLGGLSITAIVNPRVTLIGDSITQYNNAYVSLTNSLTKGSPAAVGVARTTRTGHGITTGQRGFIGNMTDLNFDGECTYTAFDANTLDITYDTPVGPDGVTSTLALNAMFNAYQSTRSIGIWPWVNSLANTTLIFNGNYGQGGAFASDARVIDATSKALAKTPAPQLIFMEIGVNDAKASVAGATIWAAQKVLIDMCFAANIPVIFISIEPLGGPTNGNFNSAGIKTATQFANSSAQTYLAANPTKGAYVNTYAVLGSGNANNDLLPNYSSDGVHPESNMAKIKSQLVWAAASPWVSSSGVTAYPSSSSDVAVKQGYTLVANYGPWNNTGLADCTGTGFINAGVSKSIPNFIPFCPSNGTGISTIVDRGNAALGWWSNLVCTANASVSPTFTLYIAGTGGVSPASLGLTVPSSATANDGSKILYGVEINCSGLNASFVGGVNARMVCTSTIADLSSSSPIVMTADSYTGFLWSASPIPIPFGCTSVSMTIFFSMTANASPVPFTIQVGRVFIRKV